LATQREWTFVLRNHAYHPACVPGDWGAGADEDAQAWPKLTLFKKDEPGDSVQVDVKVVKLQREKVFQYTAIR
jgi:hypothetical protein